MFDTFNILYVILFLSLLMLLLLFSDNTTNLDISLNKLELIIRLFIIILCLFWLDSLRIFFAISFITITLFLINKNLK